MKAYNVTFCIDDTMTYSLPCFAEKEKYAEKNVGDMIFLLTGKVITKIKANAVIFGADGSGKSLNKLKKKK